MALIRKIHDSELEHTPALKGDSGLPVMEIFFPDEDTDIYLQAADELIPYNTGLFNIYFYMDIKGHLVPSKGWVETHLDVKQGWVNMSPQDVQKVLSRYEAAWVPIHGISSKVKTTFSWKGRRPEFDWILEGCPNDLPRR